MAASSRALAGVLVMLSSMVSAAPGSVARLVVDPSNSGRLVLDHSPEGGWVLQQEGRRATISFPRAAFRLDASAVSLPPGGEIASLDVSDGPPGPTLSLDVGCDCSIAVRGHGAGRIAIEVLLPGAVEPGRSGRAPRVAPLAPPAPTVRRNLEHEAPPAGPKAKTASEDMAAVRDRLVRQIRQAAQAGIIELGSPALDTAPTDAPTASTVEAGGADQVGVDAAMSARAEQRTPRPDSPVDGRLDAVLVTAVRSEPAMAHHKTEHEQHKRNLTGPEAPNRSCIPDADLALPDPSPDVRARLAALEAQFLGEFDHFRFEPIEAAARLQLALGLYPEARALASLLHGNPKLDLLLEMITIGEGQAYAPRAFASPACPGLHGLWHAAAQLSVGHAGNLLDRFPTLARLLPKLPPALFLDFAVRFGRAAAAAGDLAAAGQFQALASRARHAEGARAAGRLLLDAAVARAEGDDHARESILIELWARYPRESAAAEGVVLLAEAILAGEIDAVGSTHALRLDLAGIGTTAASAILRQRALVAEVRLTARDLGRDAGFDLLALGRSAGAIEPEAHARTLALLASSEPAERPLAVAFSEDPQQFEPALPDPAFRAALASSFADIGLPAKAERVLRLGDGDVPRVIAAIARAYLAVGDPTAAERLASRLPEGSERATILAQSLAARGMANAAFAALSDEDQLAPAARARLAWDARDWAAAADALDALLADRNRPEDRVRRQVALDRAGGGDGNSDANSALPVPTIEAVDQYLEGLRRERQILLKVLENG